MKNRKSLWLMAAAVASATPALLADQVVVTSANMHNWAFYTTDATGIIGTGNGTTGFAIGPATPPYGTGSAHLATASGEGDGSAQLRNDA